MKTISTIALIGLGSLAVAQTVVPVEQEPRHRLAFENSYVKVLTVTFPPGDVSLFHRHDRDNVSVRITTDLTRTDVPGEQGTPQLAPVGRVAFNSASPPYTHRVANIGKTTIRIVDVELLTDQAPRSAGTRDDLAGHAIAFDNERARATRIQLAAGQSLPPHSHPHGWLSVVVTGQDAGRLDWHPAGSAIPSFGSSTPIEIVEIEHK